MGSLHIGTFGGIPVKIHMSFGLLVVFLLGVGLSESITLHQGLFFALFILCLFTCVVFHEYGHALAARRYGVATRDIILSPLGGVARLERLPSNPLQELIIAIAGPLVNILISLFVGFIFYLLYDGRELFLTFDLWRIKGWHEFLVYLFGLNIMLFLFNLIPAFPMDGGRVLRALLSMRWGRVRATKIASVVGRLLAVLFIVGGLYFGLYIQAMIGVFIFFAAGAENRFSVLEAKFQELNASDVMRRNYIKLHIGDTIGSYLDTKLQEGINSYVVYDSLGYPAGWMTDFHQIELADPEDKLLQVMGKNLIAVDPQQSLHEVYQIMLQAKVPLILVQEEGQGVIGIIDREIMKEVFS